MTILQRTFALTALTCGAAWLIKLAVIASLGSGSIPEAALWALGTLAFLVASGSGVALLLRHQPTWVRVIAAVVTLPVAFFALNALDALIKSVYVGDGWFRDEVALVLVGLAFAALGARLWTTDRSSLAV